MPAVREPERSKAFSAAGAIAVGGFVLSVPAANWMVLNVGSTCMPDGPCMVPVWKDVMAPSGVLLAGLSLVLRDMVQEEVGPRWALVAVLLGAVISAVATSAELAVASGAAFLVAEVVDLIVYTGLRERGIFVSSLTSSLVGLLLDSLIFVWVAFGSAELLLGQTIGKTWMVLATTPLFYIIRRRGRVRFRA